MTYTYHILVADVFSDIPGCRYVRYGAPCFNELRYIVENLPESDIVALKLKGSVVIRVDCIDDRLLIDGHEVSEDISFAYNLLVSTRP